MVIQINRKRDRGGGSAVAAHLDFDFTKTARHLICTQEIKKPASELAGQRVLQQV
jgi:hypothetical protein